MNTTPVANPANDDESSFPALKHRPKKVNPPAPAKTLAGPRKALLANPNVNLDVEAAGRVVAGVVDLTQFRLLVEPHKGSDDTVFSLLTQKPVGTGTAYIIKQHDRFLDLGILPDLAGARWSHQVHTDLDVTHVDLRAACPDTAHDDAGKPLAKLTLAVADHEELVRRVEEAFTKTVADGLATSNNYSTSILQTGVKEPVLLVPLEVHFSDGSPIEQYLTTPDGNSRLTSAWIARTNGTTATAAAACAEAVIGTPTTRGWKPVTQRAARDRVAGNVERTNRLLDDKVLTEAAIRSGHTMTIPAVVVVGVADLNGEPVSDLVAACEDLIATVHTENTPWAETAKSDRGMVRMLRRMRENDLISDDIFQVISGRYTPGQMHEKTDLPPHRLWAAALTLREVIVPWRGPEGTRRMLMEEFSVTNPTRLTVGKAVGATTLAGYRSSLNLQSALNAFNDGGPICDLAWDYDWSLATGEEPVTVLDTLLDGALNGEAGAKIQLGILGGIAAIIDGLLTRDRGSKDTTDGRRAPRTTPYRLRPYRIIDRLLETNGGLRTLHSIAVAHITGDLPRQFHTIPDPAAQTEDGDPYLDATGGHRALELEWDVFLAADRTRAEEAIAAAQGSTGTNEPKDEAVRLREDLLASSRTALKSARGLRALAATRGHAVFGSYDAVDDMMRSLQKARDILTTVPEPIHVDDSDDYLEADQ